MLEFVVCEDNDKELGLAIETINKVMSKYDFEYKISRFDHSLSTALITWKLTNDKKITTVAKKLQRLFFCKNLTKKSLLSNKSLKTVLTVWVVFALIYMVFKYYLNTFKKLFFKSVHFLGGFLSSSTCFN